MVDLGRDAVDKSARERGNMLMIGLGETISKLAPKCKKTESVPLHGGSLWN